MRFPGLNLPETATGRFSAACRGDVGGACRGDVGGPHMSGRGGGRVGGATLPTAASEQLPVFEGRVKIWIKEWAPLQSSANIYTYEKPTSNVKFLKWSQTGEAGSSHHASRRRRHPPGTSPWV